MSNGSERETLKAGAGRWDDAWLAGGAITSIFTKQPIKDYDIYFKSNKAFVDAVYKAFEEDGLYCLNVSKRAVTFSRGSDILQFICCDFFETPQAIFDSFDFTVCMATLDLSEEGDFTFHEDFWKHNAQKYLSFNPKTKYPIASLLRVLKYQQRGYTISQGELLKIFLASSAIDINSWEKLEDAIGGIYGDKLAIETEGEEFSISNAIERIDFDRPLIRNFEGTWSPSILLSILGMDEFIRPDKIPF